MFQPKSVNSSGALFLAWPEVGSAVVGSSRAGGGENDQESEDFLDLLMLGANQTGTIYTRGAII